ncbi:hypothetical protein KXJ69_07600 [Aureisphaera sp. CAU 1614]|uniref:DUF4258 domain-containing protein n=1 Tax=Halomarinibacterium sedimenti TaxID=2857106 RepID=A0A9X1FP54_9FLAO|nr:hypothetical protein [Halomarinibacterium sedimenti]MBW2937965.1 hypothetical protein [Halomarinibacterium sedimenti]
MSLFKRFLYYFGGFSIGLVILFFFLGGKKASCDYGPSARTLKNIRTKNRIISPEVLIQLQNKGLDTSSVSKILREGDVLFSESNTKLDSCKIYVVEGEIEKKIIKLTIENCEKRASINAVSMQ